MTMNLKCFICEDMGTLMFKTTKTKSTAGYYREYRKLYVYHGKPNQKWCYLKKEDLEKLPRNTLNSLGQNSTTQPTTQILHKPEKL